MTPQNRLDELLKIARSATPGPWDVCTNSEKNAHRAGHIIDMDQNTIAIPCAIMVSLAENPQKALRRGDANADHIATFNPSTIEALLLAYGKLLGAARWWTGGVHCPENYRCDMCDAIAKAEKALGGRE